MLPTNTTEYHHDGMGEDLLIELEKHESPINLFAVDFEAYPAAKHIKHKYKQTLNPGDCLYIPSFHFY